MRGFTAYFGVNVIIENIHNILYYNDYIICMLHIVTVRCLLLTYNFNICNDHDLYKPLQPNIRVI